MNMVVVNDTGYNDSERVTFARRFGLGPVGPVIDGVTCNAWSAADQAERIVHEFSGLARERRALDIHYLGYPQFNPAHLLSDNASDFERRLCASDDLILLQAETGLAAWDRVYIEDTASQLESLCVLGRELQRLGMVPGLIYTNCECQLSVDSPSLVALLLGSPLLRRRYPMIQANPTRDRLWNCLANFVVGSIASVLHRTGVADSDTRIVVSWAGCNDPYGDRWPVTMGVDSTNVYPASLCADGCSASFDVHGDAILGPTQTAPEQWRSLAYNVRNLRATHRPDKDQRTYPLFNSRLTDRSFVKHCSAAGVDSMLLWHDNIGDNSATTASWLETLEQSDSVKADAPWPCSVPVVYDPDRLQTGPVIQTKDRYIAELDR